MKPKWKDEEIREALNICDLVDRRWEEYAAEREKALRHTAPLASVWPQAAVIPGKSGPAWAGQHSKTQSDSSTTGNERQLLDCASPVALSGPTLEEQQAEYACAWAVFGQRYGK